MGGVYDHEHDAASQEDEFRIMTDIRNDKVVSALQVIIDHFGNHIDSHSVVLVAQLSTAFQNYFGAG